MSPIDGTQTGTTNLGQSEPVINSNEGVLHIPQRFRTNLASNAV